MSHLVAVLGPTNTGKTFYALERMMAHASGMIGLPLRLLAREVYDKVVAEKGEDLVALVTGEERIWPKTARYFVATVEAMPLSQSVEFLAIDEIQLAADPDRGHVFTHRILHARGRSETMLLGATTMGPVLEAMGLKVETNRRERFSELTYAGPIKATKLPKRSAIVAFSSEEVYAIAELLRRQRGGAAVVMGALSPRTRNAQVDLYQSGEVDYLVATDAIGMGINLDVDHIAFASRKKFDGRRRRLLTPAEMGQIAGRAGRYRTDGSFGETIDCPPLEPELVARLEGHTFDDVKEVWWRNADLDYGSINDLLASLGQRSGQSELRQCEDALDEQTLRLLSGDGEVTSATGTSARVRRLWDLCTLPDFRQAGTDGHYRLVHTLWQILGDPNARIPCDWMDGQLKKIDNTEGDIQALQHRLASIRTWTYAANRDDWLVDAERWRLETRAVEDRLSDALHERLTQRFVDRRTTALIRGMSKEDLLDAGVGAGGEITIEGHPVGRLVGLSFEADVTTKTLEGKAVRNAALQVLRPILARRLSDMADADGRAFRFDEAGLITFDEEAVARLLPGNDWMSPRVELIGGEQAEAPALLKAQARISTWIDEQVQRLLPSFHALKTNLEASGLEGLARGLAFQVMEAGGVVDLRGEDPRPRFDAEARDALKNAGVRAGRVCAYAPEAMKPLQQAFIARLMGAFRNATVLTAPSGAGSFPASDEWSKEGLASQGYLVFGPRAIRADLAERLAWEIDKRRKEAGRNLFELPSELASVVSCPGDVFPAVLREYGLTPAEKDEETGVATKWRFRPRARPDGEGRPGPQRDRSRDEAEKPTSEKAGDGGKPRFRRQPKPESGARPERRRPKKDQGPKTFSAGREETRAEDSPFAQLAALFPETPKPERKPRPKKKKRKPDGGGKPNPETAKAPESAAPAASEDVTPDTGKAVPADAPSTEVGSAGDAPKE